MPELPEVETVVRLIRPHLEQRRIESTRVQWRRTLGGPTPRAFGRSVRGARIASVGRRAKFIVCELERDGITCGALVVHLRMTGRLHVDAPDAPPRDHVRVSCGLDDGRMLHFVDVRKFGRFQFLASPEERLESLGPEPLGPEFTPEWFRRELRRRRRMIKPLLLDQEFLAGLGNIYVDESLHDAGLHPLRRSDRIPPARADVLHAAIQATLSAAIEREGSSFDTFYRTPEGNPGNYQHQFQVYGRGGQPCRSCGREITRIVVGQRGTHFCKRCQPAPRRRQSQ